MKIQDKKKHKNETLRESPIIKDSLISIILESRNHP